MVYNVNQKATTGLLQKAGLYRGLQSRVARKLGVSRQFVSAVARQLKDSRRVERALRDEMDRIERKFAA